MRLSRSLPFTRGLSQLPRKPTQIASRAEGTSTMDTNANSSHLPQEGCGHNENESQLCLAQKAWLYGFFKAIGRRIWFGRAGAVSGESRYDRRNLSGYLAPIADLLRWPSNGGLDPFRTFSPGV